MSKKLRNAYSYQINIVWSIEDQSYIAKFPDFKNISAYGKTRKEALKEAEIVLDSLIKELEIK